MPQNATAISDAHQDATQGLSTLVSLIVHVSDPAVLHGDRLRQFKAGAAVAVQKNGFKELDAIHVSFGPGAGFTGVQVLEESHSAIHTWPERGYVEIEIRICDYLRDNSQGCRQLARDIVALFGEIRFASGTIFRWFADGSGEISPIVIGDSGPLRVLAPSTL